MRKKSAKAKRKKIRILIAEDHTLLRDTLKDSLSTQKDMEIVGEAGDGQECVRLAKLLSPDIVLMDLKLPGLSGLDAIKLIKKERPAVKVLVVSGYDDDHHVLESFQCGADGYQSKTYSVPQTITHIRQIVSDGVSVPPKMLTKLLGGIQNMKLKSQGPMNSDLTVTEIKILNAFRSGDQRKQIAKELQVSDLTVRNHINNICRKLETKNILSAVLKAVDLGIISARD